MIIDGLRKNGVDVVECHEDLWKETDEKLEGIRDNSATFKKLSGFLSAYVRLVRKFRKMGSYDALIVGYAGHISEAILSSKNDEILRKKIANGGQDCFEKNFSASAIGKTVLHLIESL